MNLWQRVTKRTFRCTSIFLGAWAFGMLGPVETSMAGPPAAAAQNDAVVTTELGPIAGTVTSTHRTFFDIPYAAPPVGDRRWRSPQPAAAWTTLRDATVPGARCPQLASPLSGPESLDEDCLHLNVTTPKVPPWSRPLPVMVWLHGGAWVGGAGRDYDAHRLAVRGNVIVVTVNYRLGIFGFFGHPELPDSGAFGLEDQQAALRWVQRNIAAFGGDPRRVTLFGQSAGALSACAQLTSPSAAGLFHRAGLESGSCMMSWAKNGVDPGRPAGTPWKPMPEVHALGASIATQLGCTGRTGADTVACLRGRPVAEVLAAGRSGRWSPAFGNRVLPVAPSRAVEEGRFHRMPILSGTNRDENTLFTAVFYDLARQPISRSRYDELLRDSFGDDADRVRARYPLHAYSSPSLAWSAVTTDRGWVCPAWAGDKILAKRVPVYRYEFRDRDAPSTFGFPAPFPLGAFHTAELPYLFDWNKSAPFTPAQRELSNAMIDYWSRFAATGHVNGWGLPRWFPLGQLGQVQFLAPGPGGIHPDDFPSEHHCDFWSSLD
ncbi:carboxylesterase/lipase family protein [Pendulispora albinea]|uniref:Carboxylic ester hydrolase n=1 Tax=Pendulispora albinea TaxID=2741071 RepID=A0ABZ2M2J8_9BACT